MQPYECTPADDVYGTAKVEVHKVHSARLLNQLREG